MVVSLEFIILLLMLFLNIILLLKVIFVAGFPIIHLFVLMFTILFSAYSLGNVNIPFNGYFQLFICLISIVQFFNSVLDVEI